MISFGGMQPFSTIDYPNTLACVFFCRGCDLACFYCHNRTLLCASSPGTTDIDAEQALAFLQKRKGLLEGVVLSGGEALLQGELSSFIEQCKALGYRIKLDTNGTHPAKLKALLEKDLLNYVALDIKTTREHYEDVCGRDVYENVRQSYHVLQQTNIAFEVRTTLYPGLTLQMLAELAQHLTHAPLWRLQQFRQPDVFDPKDAERLQENALTKEDILSFAAGSTPKPANLCF